MRTQTLSRLGRLAARRPWLVIGGWLVLAVLVAGASAAFGGELQDSMSAPGVDSQRAADLLAAAQTSGSQSDGAQSDGAQSDGTQSDGAPSNGAAGESPDDGGLTAQVVVTPRDPRQTFFDSPAAAAALRELQQHAEALPNVLGSNDPSAALAAGRGAATAQGAVSPDGRVALLRLKYPAVEHLDPVDLTRLKSLADYPAAAGTLRVEVGGDLFFAFDSPPANVGELIGLAAAAVILFLAFGSLVAAGLPLLVAIVGLITGASAMALLANLFTVPTFAPVVGSMVGIGVGIDYALFIVTRHREYLRRGLTVDDAAGRALAVAGRPVVFAGGIVVVSILGLAVAGVPFMTAGAVAISLMVLIMVCASVTLLPALLGVAGHRIDRRAQRALHGAAQLRDVQSLTVPARNEPALDHDENDHRGWRRWIGHVSRHPAIYAVGSTAVLLALAAPILALRIGLPDDGSLPTDRTQRRAYDLVAQGFGPGSNGPLVVVADLNGDRAAAARLAAAVRADRGIVSVEPPRIDTEADLATIVALPTTGPQDGATSQTIRRLRSDVLPAALAGSPAEAHVGGTTALMADVGGRVFDRLPGFVAAVLALSFVLLMMVFRSVLVPLKAVLLNLLSIGASYGLLVAIFQWGWGAGLIGLQSTVPIVSFIPMFMFAILFGLSMDYEVFLLSRVREEYVQGGDNQAAVVRGIAGTARVITSAAVIMVTVFLSFVPGGDPATKMMGFGLAAAILIDATLVRMVLVPATMTLLGRANWWVPGWLDRILPHVELDGEGRVGVDEPEDDPRRAEAPVPA